MYQWTEGAQHEAERLVLEKATNDPAFRALALRDGNAAVEQATGQSLPEGFIIRFVDPAGAHLTAVLPRAANEQDELAEHELMAVAGGKGGRRRTNPTVGPGNPGGEERPRPPGELLEG